MQEKRHTFHVDLRRKSISADVWGRYYTAGHVSGALVDALSGVKPKLILELGAGRGALAGAACQKWNSAKCITVDTDQAALEALKSVVSQKVHTHHIHDALDEELADRIGLSLGSVDLGLCNPPYVRPRWRSSFGRILEDAGLSGALQSIHDAGADLLFIAQNLRLLKPKGKLGLILPDGLMTGEKYRGVREVLLREHRVEKVIQLPRRVFAKTEAQTYLVVLSKQGGETQSVALSQMHVDGSVVDSLIVSAEDAKLRLDYRYHATASKTSRAWRGREQSLAIGKITRDLVRGSIPSNLISGFSWPVFHLGDFPEATKSQKIPCVPSAFIQPRDLLGELEQGVKIARAGDILIARIGRNLHEKVCLLPRGFCVISDCVFALSVAPEFRSNLLSYLLSEEGRMALEAVSHGVGAKYLSRQDVLNTLLPSKM